MFQSFESGKFTENRNDKRLLEHNNILLSLNSLMLLFALFTDFFLFKWFYFI